jgi:hypothetical protein
MSRSRRLRRLSLAFAIGLTVAGLATSAVLAGGMAIVVPIAGDGQAITAGVAHPLRFEVLQHGVTPVANEQITVVFTDTGSGEQLSQVARPDGKVGAFAVDVVLPHAGWWTWHVVVTGLEIQSGPLVLGVLGRDGAIPGYPPAGFDPVIGTGDPLAGSAQTELVTLRSERDALAAERSALATRVRELESSVAVPLGLAALAVVLAALVGAGVAVVIRGRGTVRSISPSGEAGAFATDSE